MVGKWRASLFGQSLFWLRLRPKAISADAIWSPKLRGLYLNAAWGMAAETQRSELLGSSDASPDQLTRLSHAPVLRDSLELRIRENLSAEDVVALGQGEDAAAMVRAEVDGRPGPWVLWRNLDPATTGPLDRVFGLDASSGEIRFGDGLRGRIPPAGRDTILAVSYQTGGTSTANLVPAWGQISLISPIPGVETTFAPEPAAGGCDPEPPAATLHAAPFEIAMRDRAITLRDYEHLSMQSSSDIGQAMALCGPKGLRVLIAMRGSKVMPSKSALRELARFLNQRRAPQTQGAPLLVSAPRPIPASVDVSVVVDDLINAGLVSRAISDRILQFLNPTTGGFDGDGWRFGRVPKPDDLAGAVGSPTHVTALLDVSLMIDDPAVARFPADGMIDLTASRIRVRAIVEADETLP